MMVSPYARCRVRRDATGRVRVETCQARTGAVSGMASLQEYHPIFATPILGQKDFDIDDKVDEDDGRTGSFPA
jgi:hypothetical protein